MITDTHTHLYLEQFDKDRNQMIERAKKQGVSRFFIPAINSSYMDRMLTLENNFPNDVFLMIGLHPSYVKNNFVKELNFVKKWLDKRNFCAIGEIGIDLYWDRSFLKQQQQAFTSQIRWAKQRKMPVVIHCRDAFDEVFEVLEHEKSKDLFG
ncbi:MAG: TatD family hydrolase, partial [Tenacibaculum sp.]